MSRRSELLTEMIDVVEGRWSTWDMFTYDHEHGHERAATCDAQRVVMLAAAANAYPQAKTVDVVFDGPPGPTSGRFIDVETPDGAGVRVGQWLARPDGRWALRLSVVSDDES